MVAGRRFGKTVVSLEKCILEASKPKANVWYVAPTYKQAKLIAWKILSEWLHDPIFKRNETELSVQLPNGSTISLKGADNPDSLRGVGLDFIVLDEYSDIKKELWGEIIQPMLADRKGGAWFIGTPKGRNHFFDLWTSAHEGTLGGEWAAWRLKTADNPYIDPEEIRKAKEGDERIFLQEWEAEFTAFAGKFFTDFDEKIHVIEPLPIQPWWRKVVSIDYGFTAPSAVLWCAVNQDGDIIIYKELYQKGLTYDQLAQKIVEMTPEQVEVVVADPSIWAKEGTIGQSGAERMNDVFRSEAEKRAGLGRPIQGFTLLPADNDRKVGWGIMRELMKVVPGPFGQPTARLKILKTCYNLIRTIPSMIYSDTNPEDLQKNQDDHACDSARYLLSYITRVQRSLAPLTATQKRIWDLEHRHEMVNPNQMYR